MDGLGSSPRSYGPDRLAAGLIAFGYASLLALALGAQQDLAHRLVHDAARDPSAGVVSGLVGLAGLGPALFACSAFAKGRRWAFAYLCLIEAPRLLNFGVTLWTLKQVISTSFTPAFPLRAATALSIGVLAYGFVRGTGSIGPRPTDGRSLSPRAGDRGVGLVAVLAALASGAWGLSSTWNWVHGSGVAFSTALSAYADVVFPMATAVWVAFSLAKGRRWAFAVAVLSGVSFLVRLGQANLDAGTRIVAFRHLLLLAYGTYRLLPTFAAWARPYTNPWPERDDD